MRWVPKLCIFAGLLACGCSAPRGPFLATERDPGNKIPGIKQAVQRKDLSVARQLVTDLDSDDPAVRFYAIEGLERLTGTTRDYKYYDHDHARQPAIQRWQAWLQEQER